MHFQLAALFLSLSILTHLSAQPAIVDVVNSASHIPTGFPSAGVAPGSLFAIVGTGLGPDTPVTATFPLPTTGGLSGVSVQVAVGGANIDAIMVYAGPKQVSAILPSATPTGDGTVTLNNNGVTVTAPIKVVASAPGIFNLGSIAGLDSASTAPALAFNVNADGTTPLNLFNASAMPGQTVILAATGIGAITSDETQQGVTDAPAQQVQVFVGNAAATVTSVARGAYPAVPDGFDLSTVPSGLAAVDLIQFTVPDGVTGCIVSVVVQSGSFLSNPATIAISPDGSPCVDPTAIAPGSTVTFNNGAGRVGNIALSRIVNRSGSGASTVESSIDTGQASFIQFDTKSSDPVTAPVSSYSTALNLDIGSCNMQWVRAIIPDGTGSTPPPSGGSQGPTYLDAGPVLNIKGPNGVMQMKQSKSGFYTGSFGNSFLFPPLPASGKLFLDPGAYTADNATGGADVGPFTAALTLPNPPLKFTNIDDLVTIDRSKGVTVQWTGGDPNGYVNILGTASSLSGTTPGSVSLLGSFQCTERASAGQFTVPSYITATLPKTGSPQPLGGSGSIAVYGYVGNRFDIPGFDLGLITSSVNIGRSTIYQ